MSRHEATTKKLARLATVLGDTSTTERLIMIAKILIDELTDDQIDTAIDKIRKSEIKIPVPAKFLQMFSKETTDRDDATIIAHSLNQVAHKRGSTWAETPVFFDGVPMFMGDPGNYYENWKAAAIEVLGPVGYEVVTKMGGWRMVCHAFFESDDAVVRAQVRDLAEACLKRARAGTLNETPQLPGQAPDLVKQLAEAKKL